MYSTLLRVVRGETPLLDPFQHLSSTQALQLVNRLTDVGLDEIELPRIVVVGMQSSGKSSLLNSIIGMEILPTGGEMVTRVPLHIRLRRDDSLTTQGTAVLGTTQIRLGQSDTPQRIREAIERETIHVAGEQKGISTQALCLRLVAPNLPNLSLVDLPGLTMVACTDKGQPEDMMDQIRSLVRKWTESKRTIIACVMPSRVDLEADAALGLVKEIDPTGQRTVGVLTKPDLMGHGANVAKYLRNEASRDLRLGWGYFCVVTAPGVTETTFFEKAPYQDLPERCGVTNLTATLADALTQYVRSHVPKILVELRGLGEAVGSELQTIGTPLPTLTTERRRDFQRTIHAILKDTIQHIDTGGGGVAIRNLFVEFRSSLLTTQLVLPDPVMLRSLIEGIHGNHLSNVKAHTVVVLESLLLHDTDLFQPFRTLATRLAERVVQEIKRSMNNAFDSHGWRERFPRLVELITPHLDQTHLDTTLVHQDLEALIHREGSYLWTEDAEFRALLLQEPSNDIVEGVNALLHAYTRFLAHVFGNTVPKILMSRVVRPFTELTTSMFDDHTLLDHYVEQAGVQTRRTQLHNRAAQVRDMIQMCNDLPQNRGFNSGSQPLPAPTSPRESIQYKTKENTLPMPFGSKSWSRKGSC